MRFSAIILTFGTLASIAFAAEKDVMWCRTDDLTYRCANVPCACWNEAVVCDTGDGNNPLLTTQITACLAKGACSCLDPQPPSRSPTPPPGYCKKSNKTKFKGVLDQCKNIIKPKKGKRSRSTRSVPALEAADF